MDRHDDQGDADENHGGPAVSARDRVGEAGMTRLEVRLHPTQVGLMDGMARRLTRERRRAGRTGRRLNRSALIRAAVTVMTEARGSIHGTTEAEIADSLRRWLATDPGGDTLPRRTRDGLREAHRHLDALHATIDELLDRAVLGDDTSCPDIDQEAAVGSDAAPRGREGD